MNRKGVDVKKLTPKDQFRTKHGRSSDDGDGFVLATAPDFLFVQELTGGGVLGLGKVRGW